MTRFLFVFLLLLIPRSLHAESCTQLNNSINEGSISYAGGTFLDKDGNRVNPETITYWGNDVRTGAELFPPRTPPRSPTVGASPSPTYPPNLSFSIPVCETRMFTNNNQEAKRVTFSFGYAGSKVGTGCVEFQVNQLPNLQVITPTPTPSAVGASPTPTFGGWFDCISTQAPTPTPTPTSP